MIIIDTPIGVGTQGEVATYFSAINSQVTISLTVRSHPDPLFSWSKNGVNTASTSDESIGNDEYQSSFEIGSVEARHYGNYTVVVRSDGSNSFSKTFIVQLEQLGRFPMNILSLNTVSFDVKNLNGNKVMLHFISSRIFI